LKIMATVPVNTLQTYQARSIREDLSDVYDRLSPVDTPFVSMAGKGKASQTYHEWIVSDLQPARDDNAEVEGADAVATPSSAGDRLGNYLMISTKTASVSGTAEVVDSVGRLTTLAEAVAARTLELKRDVEKQILSNKAASPGSATTPRVSASFGSFIRTNVSRGTGGANPTLSGGTQGYPNAPATDGGTRALTESLAKQIIASAWAEGANPEIIFVGAVGKQSISTWAGNSTKMQDIEDKRLVTAIDYYVSDFGTHKVVPSRLIRSRDCFIIDPSKVSVDYLRPTRQKALGVTGDSERREILVEYTLKVHNEKAHGLIADIA
jgi:hypothetical protein